MSFAIALPLLLLVAVISYLAGWRARGRNRLLPPDPRTIVRNRDYC